MSNDRIQYVLSARRDPTPEEIAYFMRVGKRLQNQAFRDIPRDFTTWLTRVFGRREVESAHADTVANHARKVLFG
jgi:hypothetical protein